MFKIIPLLSRERARQRGGRPRVKIAPGARGISPACRWQGERLQRDW